MSRKMNTKAEHGNIYSDYDLTKGYAIIGDSIFEDNRLDFADFYLLCKLIKLSKTRFYITQRKSSRYFRMSPKTYQLHLKRLIDLGYIEKQRYANTFVYRIRKAEYINKLCFDYAKMKRGEYTPGDLERFINDPNTDPRFLPIIKRLYNGYKAPFEKMLEDVKNIEQNDDDMPF